MRARIKPSGARRPRRGRPAPGRRGGLALLALALLALAAPSPAQAASREPLDVMRAELRGAPPPGARSFQRALTAAGELARPSSAPAEATVTSSSYGAEQIAAVAGTLGELPHGPEMAGLSAHVATPAEVAQSCGATVIACYLPATATMIVSGAGHAVAGVPPEFAIAHEYGHHIANSRQGGPIPPLGAGTIRWATYERVCQLTRMGRLFPGDQAAHYWEDPEEAFAESYAHLAQPSARVSWQFSDLLRPTAASLDRLREDIARPWSGASALSLTGTVAPSPEAPPTRRSAGARIDPAVPLRSPSTWARAIRTPLDGPVTVTLQAPAGARLDVSLRDPADGRLLASARTGEDGAARLSYGNCGRAGLSLEVRGSAADAARFQATVLKP